MRYGHGRKGIIGITLKPETLETWAYTPPWIQLSDKWPERDEGQGRSFCTDIPLERNAIHNKSRYPG